MKPYKKIGSFLLAAVMLISTLAVAGCTPVSLQKEWSYKADNNELAIGVYVYALDNAYQQAKSYAEKLDDYDETKDSWLDMEITDDDGKKAVAKDWIKEKAKLACLSYLAVDSQLKAEKAELTDGQIASADETAKEYWNVGPYPQYGIMPMKSDLEPYGISLESFSYCTAEYSAKQQALFDATFGVGGSKEVSDADLTKFFNESYTSYSYFTANLYTTETGEDGESTTNKALSEADAKKLTDELDGYAKSINEGKSDYAKSVKAYMDKNKIESDPTTSNVELLENSSLGDEVKKELEKLETGKAATVKVGDGDSAVYYLVVKNDIKASEKEYIGTADKREEVLASMKKDDFQDYIEELAGKLKYEENTSAINKYDPKMFFVPVEPTTAASTTAEEESSAE